jgi:integrase
LFCHFFATVLHLGWFCEEALFAGLIPLTIDFSGIKNNLHCEMIMAKLNLIGNSYHVRFGFKGITRRYALKTSNLEDARNEKNKIEDTIYQIKMGRLIVPEDCQDVHYFVFTGGKETDRQAPACLTLQDIWNGYFESIPSESRDSIKTERTHIKHFIAILKNKNIRAINFKDLQEYIKTRLEEDGNRGKTTSTRTIRKEMDTFKGIWNNYALPLKLVSFSFELTFVAKFKLGKESTKAKFQTWEQIENQISRGNLKENEAEFLWDGLFLDLSQIKELLDFVKNSNDSRKWIYPMFLFAAHTGARRSELLRSEIQDWDFQNKTVSIREKKKDKDKEYTTRDINLSDELAQEMKCWIEKNGEGSFVFSKNGIPLTEAKVANVFAKKYYFSKRKDQWILREWYFNNTKWSVLRGWHIFRHSLASNLANAGVDPRLIDDILGHQTEEMRKRYQHMFPQKQKAALNLLFQSDIKAS